MFVVANDPQKNDGDESESGSGAAARAALARADFSVDQREERRDEQSEQEAGKHNGLEDENNVPGIPLLGKGPERSDAVVIGEVEQDMAKAGEAGKKEEQSPARREIWIFRLAAAKTPN